MINVGLGFRGDSREFRTKRIIFIRPCNIETFPSSGLSVRRQFAPYLEEKSTSPLLSSWLLRWGANTYSTSAKRENSSAGWYLNRQKKTERWSGALLAWTSDGCSTLSRPFPLLWKCHWAASRFYFSSSLFEPPWSRPGVLCDLSPLCRASLVADSPRPIENGRLRCPFPRWSWDSREFRTKRIIFIRGAPSSLMLSPVSDRTRPTPTRFHDENIEVGERLPLSMSWPGCSAGGGEPVDAADQTAVLVVVGDGLTLVRNQKNKSTDSQICRPQCTSNLHGLVLPLARFDTGDIQIQAVGQSDWWKIQLRDYSRHWVHCEMS